MSRFDIDKLIKHLERFGHDDDIGKIVMLRKLADYYDISLKYPEVIQMSSQTHLEFTRFMKDPDFRRMFETSHAKIVTDEDRFLFKLVDGE